MRREKMLSEIVVRTPEKLRLGWLDALRALAMLFVIYGHFYERYEFFLFTSPIKIPLFFAISGYLTYGKTENVKVFFRRLCKRIILPSLILTLISGSRYILMRDFLSFLNYMGGVLTGEKAWYIVCCVVALSVFYFLQGIAGTGWKLGASVLLITAVGFVLSALDIGELFQVNTALICQFYLLIGYCIHKYENKLRDLKLRDCLGLVGIYLILCIGSMFLFPRSSLDVHNNIYYNIPYCFLLIAVGCVALFSCAQRITKFPRWFCMIGQNTLVFYLHASLWKTLLSRALSYVGVPVVDTWYSAIFWLVVSCAGCGVESFILTKICPEAVGKTRKKKVISAEQKEV